MILWQFGSCSVCNSHIGSLVSRTIWYPQLIYPLLWNEKSHSLPNLGCPCSHNRGRPSDRLWFYGSLDTIPAILGPWVQGVFDTLSSYVPCFGIKSSVYGQVWGNLVPTTEGVPITDYNLVVLTIYCMYKQYWVCESKGCLVHKAHIPPAVELKVAYIAKFVVPLFPQTTASLW